MLADTGNDVVRVVDLVTGTIETLIGPAAGLSAPHDVAIGPGGAIAVADTGNRQVHVFGEDGTWRATADAELGAPVGVAWDDLGAVWFADRDHHLIFGGAGRGTRGEVVGDTRFELVTSTV